MEAKLNRSARRSKLAALGWGRRAESWAALWLMLKGYRILARRHKDRGSGAGEIDIIARKGGIIAFIEVKARRDFVTGVHSVTPRQIRRVSRGAEAFLARHPDLATLSPRFDAIVLVPGRWPHHIIDAWREPD